MSNTNTRLIENDMNPFKLNTLIIDLNLSLIGHLSQGNANPDSIKWFGRFCTAMQRYIQGTPASSAEKVKIAWQNMPPDLQRNIAAAARFAGCDRDLTSLVGELPEPSEPQSKIAKDPMF